MGILWVQDNPRDLIFGEGCPVKPTHLLKVGGELCAHKIGTPKVGTPKTGTPKVCTLKVCTLKVCILKVCTPKVYTLKVCNRKVCTRKVCTLALLAVALDPQFVVFKNGFQFRLPQGFSLVLLQCSPVGAGCQAESCLTFTHFRV